MKFGYLFIALILCSLPLAAQQRTVTGTVTSTEGEVIAGVTVVVGNTPLATHTDDAGRYSITVSGQDAELVFSYLSHQTQTIRAGSREVINVILEATTKMLDEVVLVGFGTVRKSDLTSSIATVQGKDVQDMTLGNVGQALQGKVSGVQVVSGGSPGANPKVLIRGFTSLNLNTDPLYVVDGVPMGSNANFLNNNEIDRIEVLKDASASAIYGSRASNGVILITTKRGLEGKTRFTFDYAHGLQRMQQPFDMADAPEYAAIFNLASANAGLPAMYDAPETYLGKTTNWWDAGIRKTSPQQNASLLIQGGSSKSNFAVSLNYYNQDSFYEEGGWQKLTGRISSDYRFNKVVSAGFSLNPRYESWGQPGNWDAFNNIDPITPIYKPESQLTGDENEYSIYARSPTYIWNPVATVKRWNEQNASYAMSNIAYLQLSPIDKLVIRSQGAFELDSRKSDSFSPDFVIDAAHEFQANSVVSRSQPMYRNWSIQTTATYMDTYNDRHNLTMMVGNTLEEWNGSTLVGTKYKIPNNSDVLRELDAATLDPQASGNAYTNSVLSYLGRVTYNYLQRYYLTATYRVDGSSKFLDANKWASFPSVSVAWRLSEEPLLANVTAVDEVKLRLGWGRVGNQNLPASVYLSQLGQNYYVIGNDIVNTTYPTAVANKDIRWETVEDLNGGIDFSLFGGQLNGSAEYYIKNTRDMLFQKAYPSYSGYPNDARIWTNIGSMRVHGVDLNVGYQGTKGGFRYGLSANFTTFRVTTTELTGDKEPLYGSNQRTRTVVGEAPGYFYGYVADGIFQNKEQLNSHTSNSGKFLQPYAQAGDIRFVDTNNDGVLNADDRTNIGSPWADFTAGLNMEFGYKGFDLLASLYASVGNDVVNLTKDNLFNGLNLANKKAGLLDQAWNGENTSNTVPRLSRTDNNENFSKFSSYYVEDGSYVRLRNLQLGYTWVPKMPESMRIERIRIFIAGQNAVTFTGYSGVEPEIGGDVLGFGFGGWNYPVLPTYLMGINLTF